MASKIVQLKNSAGEELNPIPALASPTRTGGRYAGNENISYDTGCRHGFNRKTVYDTRAVGLNV